jgi:hypothetical protein
MWLHGATHCPYEDCRAPRAEERLEPLCARSEARAGDPGHRSGPGGGRAATTDAPRARQALHPGIAALARRGILTPGAPGVSARYARLPALMPAGSA